MFQTARVYESGVRHLSGFSQEDTADIFKKPAAFFHCRSTVGDCVDGVDAARLVRAAR